MSLKVKAIKVVTVMMADELNKIENHEHQERGYVFPADFWTVKDRQKYFALDCGTSGAFLVEKETGEIYNISGYGRPDKNKKIKADIGNILTVDPAVLHRKRWNYLTKRRGA